MLTLYDYHRSSAGYRVRISLALKCAPHARIDVSLLAGEQRSVEHRARNPQGLVPVLDTGEAMLTQSLAIIEWLDHAYPEPRLIPQEPLARARAMARAQVIACDIHPIDNLRVLKRLEQQFGADAGQKAEWYRHWISEGFAALEAMAPATGPFLGGEAPGVADVFLVPQMYNARRFDTPLDAFPRLLAADAAASALPAFQSAHPDRVKPAA